MIGLPVSRSRSRMGEALEQGLVEHRGLHHRVDHDVLQGHAGGIAPGLAAQGFIHCELDRRQDR